jgi:hypothetical protein
MVNGAHPKTEAAAKPKPRRRKKTTAKNSPKFPDQNASRVGKPPRA